MAGERADRTRTATVAEESTRPDIRSNPLFVESVTEAHRAVIAYGIGPKSRYEIVPPLFVVRNDRFTFPGLYPPVLPLFGTAHLRPRHERLRKVVTDGEPVRMFDGERELSRTEAARSDALEPTGRNFSGITPTEAVGALFLQKTIAAALEAGEDRAVIDDMVRFGSHMRNVVTGVRHMLLSGDIPERLSSTYDGPRNDNGLSDYSSTLREDGGVHCIIGSATVAKMVDVLGGSEGTRRAAALYLEAYRASMSFSPLIS